MIRQAPTTPPQGEEAKLREALNDLVSHRGAWRDAIVLALLQAKVSLPDIDDKAYWRHELDVFDRTFEALTPSSLPIAPDGRLRQALELVIPIRVHDGPDYAEVYFGDGSSHSTQAMTMNPDDWREIQSAWEALTAAPQPPSPGQRKVTQADRDFAARWGPYGAVTRDLIRDGKLDHYPCVQEAMAHRLAPPPSPGQGEEGSCYLCAGKCRGHGFYNGTWGPEPGSQAARDAAAPPPSGEAEAVARAKAEGFIEGRDAAARIADAKFRERTKQYQKPADKAATVAFDIAKAIRTLSPNTNGADHE